MPRVQKKTNEVETPQGDLEILLQESNALKKALHQKLKSDPENLGLHRVYCVYIRRILDIHKTLIEARSIDRESLLIAALKCVVLTLVEQGESAAAETIGSHLEAIGEKVREKWQEQNASSRATTKSAPLSNQPPLLSAKTPRKKKKSGSNAP